MAPDLPDIPLLCTELKSLVNDLGLGASELHGTSDSFDFLKDLKLNPEDLKLRLGKTTVIMKNAKRFLDSCDSFLQPLANMNVAIAAPVYGAVKCIVTVSACFSHCYHISATPQQITAAKSEILDGTYVPIVYCDLQLTTIL